MARWSRWRREFNSNSTIATESSSSNVLFVVEASTTSTNCQRVGKAADSAANSICCRYYSTIVDFCLLCFVVSREGTRCRSACQRLGHINIGINSCCCNFE